MLNSALKTISFVIPVRPGNYPTKALAHISSLDYPLELVEVLIAEGRQPSLQRNQAVAQASGEIIYFLDDDSFVSPHCISAGLNYINRKRIGAVGGPALTHNQASFFESLCGEVVGSPFGTFTTRSRFRAVGIARRVRGEELILCNLMVPRKIYQIMSGLNVRLYPNEENELFKRMRKAGYRFYYLPDMIVRRTKRNSIGAFARQMFSYGHGRGRHILRGFSAADLVFLLPTGFVVYLALLLLFPSKLLALPLLAYLLFIGCGASLIMLHRKSVLAALVSFPLFLTMHITYGVGLVFGLLHANEQTAKTDSSVKISRIAFPVQAAFEPAHALNS